jgi:chaperone required for assembly of F1-ATPase
MASNDLVPKAQARNHKPIYDQYNRTLNVTLSLSKGFPFIQVLQHKTLIRNP